jgi:uncharacterized protein (TIGR00369 family)
MAERQHTVFDAAPLTDGEWAGWTQLRGGDPFEDFVGPFYFRDDPDAGPVCALRLEPRHMNGSQTVHGGCLMTLADLSMFGIARRALDYAPAVTVTMTSEFVGPARAGELVRATGEVVRAGNSLIFVRGLVWAEDAPALIFGGVIKKFRTAA